MVALSTAQKQVALQVLRSYQASPPDPETNLTLVEEDIRLDRDRRALIKDHLAPLVARFLAGGVPLAEFKSEIDRTNKRNEHWGFKGVKGQMFFNMLFNASADEAELTVELRAAIAVPESDDMAKSRLRNFTSYVRRIGEDWVEGGGSKHSRPNPASIPFFLSYFWQIQAIERWPVFYTSSVQALSNWNLYQPAPDLAEAYIAYVHLHNELQALFSATTRRPFTLYDIEHVWWYAAQEEQAPAGPAPAGTPPSGAPAPSSATPAQPRSQGSQGAPLTQLPDSYVPPIVAIIPRLAANDGLLEDAAKASGTSIARALEKSVHAAFTILGYDTELLGQGQGRCQDGNCVAADFSYALLWDSKARQGGYSMGTDDRTIREYITTASRELKRKRHLRNLYYLVISSRFPDDADDLIRGIKMDTDINEVCLIESEALVAMVDVKLRDPHQVTLGPDGLQRLFCTSGRLTAKRVREELG